MLENERFTGTQINYLAVCHRKLWLFSRGLEMERESQSVAAGKITSETSYSRENKEVQIGDVAVLDWVENRVGDDGVLTVHEVKQSKAVSESHTLQMLFYLRLLRERGVEARGQIDYPLLKQKQVVELDAQAEVRLDVALRQIGTVVRREEAPPKLDSKRFCESCAYFEFCWS